MGIPLALSNTTIRLSAGWNAFYFWGVWAVCIIGVGICLWGALRSKRWARWTTQDILLQVHDLPYMFLLMVGVALVRKPGCVTAMIFINFLLAQLLFGSGHGALDWTDGLTQGIFCDLYLVARRGRVYGPGASRWSMVVDGLAIGMLRAAPNSFLTDWIFDPYLNSIYYTVYQMWTDTWSNALGNGVEAAISAVLALRVARSVVPSLGARRAPADGEADPFAEPATASASASLFAEPPAATQGAEGDPA